MKGESTSRGRSIYLSDELMERLEELSRTLDVSKSKIIQAALEKQLPIMERRAAILFPVTREEPKE